MPLQAPPTPLFSSSSMRCRSSYFQSRCDAPSPDPREVPAHLPLLPDWSVATDLRTDPSPALIQKIGEVVSLVHSAHYSGFKFQCQPEIRQFSIFQYAANISRTHFGGDSRPKFSNSLRVFLLVCRFETAVNKELHCSHTRSIEFKSSDYGVCGPVIYLVFSHPLLR